MVIYKVITHQCRKSVVQVLVVVVTVDVGVLIHEAMRPLGGR